MTVAEILVLIAKEFSDLAPEEIAGIITIADQQIAQGLCGDMRNTLVAYLAAHILTIANRAGGATGDVESISEGHKSIKYTNSTANVKNSLSKTSYGQEFDRLSRSCIFAARTRVSLTDFKLIQLMPGVIPDAYRRQ